MKKAEHGCFSMIPLKGSDCAPVFSTCSTCKAPMAKTSSRFNGAEKHYDVDSHGCVACPKGMVPVSHKMGYQFRYDFGKRKPAECTDSRYRQKLCRGFEDGRRTTWWNSVVCGHISAVYTAQDVSDGSDKGVRTRCYPESTRDFLEPTQGTAPTSCVSVGMIPFQLLVGPQVMAGWFNAFYIRCSMWKRVYCVSVQENGRTRRTCANTKKLQFMYADTCKHRPRSNFLPSNWWNKCTTDGCPQYCGKSTLPQCYHQCKDQPVKSGLNTMPSLAGPKCLRPKNTQQWFKRGTYMDPCDGEGPTKAPNVTIAASELKQQYVFSPGNGTPREHFQAVLGFSRPILSDWIDKPWTIPHKDTDPKASCYHRCLYATMTQCTRQNAVAYWKKHFRQWYPDTSWHPPAGPFFKAKNAAREYENAQPDATPKEQRDERAQKINKVKADLRKKHPHLRQFVFGCARAGPKSANMCDKTIWEKKFNLKEFLKQHGGFAQCLGNGLDLKTRYQIRPSNTDRAGWLQLLMEIDRPSELARHLDDRTDELLNPYNYRGSFSDVLESDQKGLGPVDLPIMVYDKTSSLPPALKKYNKKYGICYQAAITN